MEKKIVTSKAKVPENGCVVVRIRSQEKKDAIMRNICVSEKDKERARARKARFLARKAREERKRQGLEGDGELKASPFKNLK